MFLENELNLNDNEEYVIVHKDHPNWFLKDVNLGWGREINWVGKTNISSFTENEWQKINSKYFENYTNPHKNDTNDIKDSFRWNTGLSQRKKINKNKSLFYFLNGLSGRTTDDYMFFLSQTDLYKAHNVCGLEKAGGWHNGPFVDLELVKDFELRKYNKDSRKVYDVAVDFNCYNFAKNFEQMFKMSLEYGQAVSGVVKKLLEVGNINEDSYILSSKFDCKKYKKSYNFSEVPHEKDMYMSKVIKDYKLKNECVNLNNGFSAIHFDTEEELNKFLLNYKEKEKVLTVIKMKDLIENKAYDFEFLKFLNFNKNQEQQKMKMK